MLLAKQHKNSKHENSFVAHCTDNCLTGFVGTAELLAGGAPLMRAMGNDKQMRGQRME